MNMNSVVLDKTSGLLHAYLECENSYLEPDAFPLLGYFSTLLHHNVVDDIWDADTAYELVCEHLRSLKITQHTGITPEVCERFTKEFVKNLKENVEEVWLVIPIGNAKSSSPIEFDRFLILPHQIPQQEKLDILTNRILLDKTAFLDFAAHTERAKSRYFYDNSLLCVRVKHQFERIYKRSRFVAIWLVATLRVLFFAEASFRDCERNYAVGPKPKESHLQVIGERNKQHRNVRDIDLTCRFSIEWLKIVDR